MPFRLFFSPFNPSKRDKNCHSTAKINRVKPALLGPHVAHGGTKVDEIFIKFISFNAIRVWFSRNIKCK